MGKNVLMRREQCHLKGDWQVSVAEQREQVVMRVAEQ